MSMGERTKLYYDQCKHMTTLAAGANVFIITIYEKLSRSPHWSFLIAFSITAFCISLFFLLIAMTGFATHNPERDVSDPDYQTTSSAFLWGVGTFWSGFMFLLVFFWRNLNWII